MTFKIWGTESAITPSGIDIEAVTMLPTGGYVVTYRENQKIAFQLYDGNGAKVGGEHFVAASAAPQHAPDVLAYDSEGHFVIAWTESPTNTGRTLRTERFNFDGTSAGATTVSTVVTYDGAQLSQNGNGGYSVSYIESGVPMKPRLAGFASDGNLVADVFLTSVDTSQVSDVAWLGGSKHLVSYTDGG